MGIRRGGRSGALLLLAVAVGGSWWALQVVLELRDWLDSDTWVATPSTSFRVQPRTSGVTVYHDPDWPARAVLVREVDAGLWIALGLGLGVVAVMVGVPVLVFGGLWWWLWRQLRR